MKRIGVVSDTHLRSPDAFLERIASGCFAGVDLIVHAGDLVTLDVLDAFACLGKDIIAVCGNMDGADVRRTCPASRCIELEGLTLGIIHGWGAPSGIRQRVLGSFKRVDAVIYGHTHAAFSGHEAGVYFFNPGSPTDSRFTSSRSVGIITIHEGSITGEHIEV
jgi:putative phosphoesterase